jgi:hypothetical protein
LSRWCTITGGNIHILELQIPCCSFLSISQPFDEVSSAGALYMGYSDVSSFDIVPSESFTRHELPALLGTPLVDGHMERKLANVQEAMYIFTGGAPRAIDLGVRVWCVVHFLYGWIFD